MVRVRLTLPQLRERLAERQRRYQNTPKGRVCSHCGAPDNARAFASGKKCSPCALLLRQNGERICTAPNCNIPAYSTPTLFSPNGTPLVENAYFCRRHTWKPGYRKLQISCRGRVLEMFFPPNVPVKGVGKVKDLAENSFLVLGLSDFWAYRIKRPIAVMGIDPVPTRDTAYTLLEFVHEPGKCDETGNYALTPEWFERRFGQGKQLKTWKRSFERAKQRLRGLGLDPTNMDMTRAAKILSLGKAAWFSEDE